MNFWQYVPKGLERNIIVSSSRFQRARGNRIGQRDLFPKSQRDIDLSPVAVSKDDQRYLFKRAKET